MKLKFDKYNAKFLISCVFLSENDFLHVHVILVETKIRQI